MSTPGSGSALPSTDGRVLSSRGQRSRSTLPAHSRSGSAQHLGTLAPSSPRPFARHCWVSWGLHNILILFNRIINALGAGRAQSLLGLPARKRYCGFCRGRLRHCDWSGSAVSPAGPIPLLAAARAQRVLSYFHRAQKSGWPPLPFADDRNSPAVHPPAQQTKEPEAS